MKSARSSNGKDRALSRRRSGFNSRPGHKYICRWKPGVGAELEIVFRIKHGEAFRTRALISDRTMSGVDLMGVSKKAAEIEQEMGDTAKVLAHLLINILYG